MPGIKDLMRTTFRIRAKRRLDSSEGFPELGARLVFNGIRMRVSSPMHEQLWQWLQLQGWRECRYRNDRRAYVDMPREAFERLKHANPKQRERTHRRIVEFAQRRLAR